MHINDYDIKTKIWKEKKVFVIEAVDIPLVTQGNDLTDAVDNFADAFILSIQDEEFKRKAEPFRIKEGQANIPIGIPLELILPHGQITSLVRQRSDQTS